MPNKKANLEAWHACSAAQGIRKRLVTIKKQQAAHQLATISEDSDADDEHDPADMLEPLPVLLSEPDD